MLFLGSTALLLASDSHKGLLEQLSVLQRDHFWVASGATFALAVLVASGAAAATKTVRVRTVALVVLLALAAAAALATLDTVDLGGDASTAAIPAVAIFVALASFTMSAVALLLSVSTARRAAGREPKPEPMVVRRTGRGMPETRLMSPQVRRFSVETAVDLPPEMTLPAAAAAPPAPTRPRTKSLTRSASASALSLLKEAPPPATFPLVQPAANERDASLRGLRSVRVGCGAGFAGDRIPNAARLLQEVELDYLVLECLAERTLSAAAARARRGEVGYDPRLPDWLRALCPLALERGVTIITNMGAADPRGAAQAAREVLEELGLGAARVATVSEDAETGWTYLGADAVLDALRAEPDVVITGRVADPSLFLAPIVKALGWSLDNLDLVAQGTVASHLLECGCQLTGGYFSHPASPRQHLSAADLSRASLPFAEVFENGRVFLAKAAGSAGELSAHTCSQQLLYEIQDPTAYITPDLTADFTRVAFRQLGADVVELTGARGAARPATLLRLLPADCRWTAVAEISYGGLQCLQRAHIARDLVTCWLAESAPGVPPPTVSFIGANSLYNQPVELDAGAACPPEVRVRFSGCYEERAHAKLLLAEVMALYTNGPAGGGGVSVKSLEETSLYRNFVPRAEVGWSVSVSAASGSAEPESAPAPAPVERRRKALPPLALSPLVPSVEVPALQRVPGGVRVQLYQVAHSRAGDKGDVATLSLIPFHSADLPRLRAVITPAWVASAFTQLFGEKASVDVYTLQGIAALNIVLTSVLDGGVTISRRADRHGKSLSDFLLSQHVELPDLYS